jgi:hypothetical protein
VNASAARSDFFYILYAGETRRSCLRCWRRGAPNPIISAPVLTFTGLFGSAWVRFCPSGKPNVQNQPPRRYTTISGRPGCRFPQGVILSGGGPHSAAGNAGPPCLLDGVRRYSAPVAHKSEESDLTLDAAPNYCSAAKRTTCHPNQSGGME